MVPTVATPGPHGSSAASTEVVAPPDVVQDQIGFCLNNMQASNVTEQSQSLREILEANSGCGRFGWLRPTAFLARPGP